MSDVSVHDAVLLRGGRLDRVVKPVEFAAAPDGLAEGDLLICRCAGTFLRDTRQVSAALGRTNDADMWRAVTSGRLVDVGLLRTRALLGGMRRQELPAPTDQEAITELLEATGLLRPEAEAPNFAAADARLSFAAETLSRAEVPLHHTACKNFIEEYDAAFEAGHAGFPKSGGLDQLPLSGGLIQRDASGALAVSDEQEGKFLAGRIIRLTDHFDRPLSLPPAADGAPPRCPAGWGPYAKVDPALRAWFRIKQLDRWRTAAGAGVFRQTVQTVPTLAADAAPPLDAPPMLASAANAEPLIVRLPELDLLAHVAYVRKFLPQLFRPDIWRSVGESDSNAPLTAAVRALCESPDLALLAAESLAYGLSGDAAATLARAVGSIAAPERLDRPREALLRERWTGLDEVAAVDGTSQLLRVAGLADVDRLRLIEELHELIREICGSDEETVDRSILNVFRGEGAADRDDSRGKLFRLLEKLAADSNEPSAVDRVRRARASVAAASAALRVPAFGAAGTFGGSVEPSAMHASGVLLTRGEIHAALVCELERAGCRPAAVLPRGVLCLPPALSGGSDTCRTAAVAAAAMLLPELATPIEVRAATTF
ncbi:hypothetical protein [Alienimonas sp. DA493]|uniref:hypothetical protein n=1 Tax=Alienimonas sp. DA493 TaxID=3373605 RepID=UPI003753F6AF